MDQVRIGRFIAEMRKTQNFTQRQLADLLSVSDKTISKWECGKGLPEVSLMLPLCDALHITVNDLLSGERLSDTEYQERAEKNMVDLIKENEENKKRMLLSIICGVITVIACWLADRDHLVSAAAHGGADRFDPVHHCDCSGRYWCGGCAGGKGRLLRVSLLRCPLCSHYG